MVFPVDNEVIGEKSRRQHMEPEKSQLRPWLWLHATPLIPNRSIPNTRSQIRGRATSPRSGHSRSAPAGISRAHLGFGFIASPTKGAGAIAPIVPPLPAFHRRSCLLAHNRHTEGVKHRVVQPRGPCASARATAKGRSGTALSGVNPRQLVLATVRRRGSAASRDPLPGRPMQH